VGKVKRKEESSMKWRIRVLSVDDHPLLREGIGALLGSQMDMELLSPA